MRDIRLLTLYKQHYLDQYDVQLDSQISCLGYYDGLDIQQVEQAGAEYNLAPITELWYSTGEKIREFSGGYSNQNIGLFRCVCDEERKAQKDIYWREEKKLPFFAVGFIKVNNCEHYDEISQKIEKQINNQADGEGRYSCLALTYCTYDNADLVLLLKSNSLTQIETNLKNTEAMSEIIYLHSIIGIEEAYLKECKNQNMILEQWNGTQCMVEEPVARINIRLATSGDSCVLANIKHELDKINDKWTIKGYDKGIYSYLMGHANVNIMLDASDVRSLLVFLLPGGFATHQNILYEHGVYNIETEIIREERTLDEVTKNSSFLSDNASGKVTWCKSRIERYRTYFKDEIEGDDSLFSYYQALVQTLNALDQYERFRMSREIFDLIFPSFHMFDTNLKKALANNNGGVGEEIMKDSLCQYLECVNSVIYHTIHTDQMYLMVPGYSGTSFSIPLKLNLFYSWFVNEISKLLNDNNRKYSCILTPVMESRPETDVINISDGEEEKLISVRLSQRMLYQPKELMVILAHEMGHYIGRQLRAREKRLGHLIKTLSYYIAEAIFPEEYEPKTLVPRQINIFSEMKKVKRSMQEKLSEILKQKKVGMSTQAYYSEMIQIELERWVTETLEKDGVGREIYEIIQCIPNSVLGMLGSSESEYVDDMRYIAGIQRALDCNRRRLLASGVMRVIISELVAVYREVFSDVSAAAILECTKEDFGRAFNVSEGKQDKDTPPKIEQIMRLETMYSVMFQEDNVPYEIKSDDCGMSGEGRVMCVTREEQLLANMPNYIWVKDHLQKYAKECLENIHERLSLPEYKIMVAEVREIYRMFDSPDYACGDIYKKIMSCITKYRTEVDREYVKTIEADAD